MPDIPDIPLDFGVYHGPLPCWRHGEQPAAFSVRFKEQVYHICPLCVLMLLEQFCAIEKLDR
jgi:hypothetical protein